jgi:hypothetical protein
LSAGLDKDEAKYQPDPQDEAQLEAIRIETRKLKIKINDFRKANHKIDG